MRAVDGRREKATGTVDSTLDVSSSKRRCSSDFMHIFLFSDVDYMSLSCWVPFGCCALLTWSDDHNDRDLANTAKLLRELQ